MTLSRKSQVSLEATSFYHCYVRCVRRAYLCGVDRETGQNFDHRKQWLVSRIRFLSYVFAIDVCAYAVMSNHYHVVLHANQDKAETWSDEEVVERWLQLYKAPLLIQRWRKNAKAMSKAELDKVFEIIADWRGRLFDISWFMRSINEKIARMANEEDNCKGRFWEGRFSSQALLDEAALLSCMAYVDLNPVRASLAVDLMDSDFTSIQQRLYDYSKKLSAKMPLDRELKSRITHQEKLKDDLELSSLPQAPLMPFDGSSHTDIHLALPFTREDYFDLVDSTGRIIREDKRGAISAKSEKLLARLGIKSTKWIDQVQNFGRRYGCCVGSVQCMQNYAEAFDLRWKKGVGNSRGLYLVGVS
jgi:hypothetical protein